ncbi:hypothetical protein L1987_00201 [Smallanthus sonchifolius]|uniref:Uncharacterized protein n=1 Tax=Smallanthus sonchifolius TaxID=185202 RepID=A0ACB9K1H8_9ASTR|nr:hypothetical protein L1987_00201 [Smallanthus sonchifolius]
MNMEVLLKMGKFTGITSELALAVDKANYIPVSKRAPVTAQVVIGTPGTINKWVAAKKLGTSNLKILVFDEADHMLAESGFKEDSEDNEGNCQVESQMSGATVFCYIQRHCEGFRIENCERAFCTRIQPNERKSGKQSYLLNQEKVLHKALVKYGYEVTTIKGALTQEDRDKVIKEFKAGFTHVLISTDLLARGFDQSQVNLVVNYDLPVIFDNTSEPDNEVYLHRIGRAGRFGRKGNAFC